MDSGERQLRDIDFDPPELDLPLLAERLQLLRITILGQQVGLVYIQSGGDQLFIADIEVQGLRRRAGFGTAAITKLAQMGREAGFKRLTGRIEGTASADVDELERWYRNRGFTVERRGSDAWLSMALDPGS